MFEIGTKTNPMMKGKPFQQMAPNQLDSHMTKHKTNPKLL